MFGSKIVSVVDSVRDNKFYSKIAAEHGIDPPQPGETNVVKHEAVVNIKKFPICLPFVIRYLLTEIRKTKKMGLLEHHVKTDDKKILVNRLIKNIKMLRIDSACDCDGFQLDVRNDNQSADIETGKSYIYVNSRDIKFTKGGKVVPERFINDMNLCPLEFGHHISFAGVIEEQNSYSVDSTFMYTTSLFPSNFTVGDNGKLRYYDGSFTLVYIDNVDPKQLLRWAFEFIIELVNSIENNDNMVEQFQGSFAITVPFDRSSIIAGLIDTYMVMVTSPAIIITDKYSITKQTKMMIDAPKDQIEILLKTTFNKIREEMTNLIADL